MTIKTNYLFSILLMFSLGCFAQMDTYQYERALTGIEDEWHNIIIPSKVFENLQPDLSDLRIYGLTSTNDTIVAPYLLETLSDQVVQHKIPFKIINRSKGAEGFYYTFQVPTETSINAIDLDFKVANFDWNVSLQGSQDQQEWFTILEDYRILSIQNNITNYSFSQLRFPEANYTYLRLLVKTKETPQLKGAHLNKVEVNKGTILNFPIRSMFQNTDRGTKITEVDVVLEETVPVSELHIEVENTYDFYRALKIEYRSDSLNTEKGWTYQYSTLTKGVLHSLEPQRFSFKSTLAKHLKVTLYNKDNEPLSLGKIKVYGPQHQLLARFSQPAAYRLVYGKASAKLPSYDIARFKSKVPKDLKALHVGDEVSLEKQKSPEARPLFQNKYWLWGIIGVIILILGGFTLSMMKKR